MRLKEKGAYICGHNMLKAHAKTYHMYNQLFRAQQGGKIGIVIPCRGNFPASLNDTESSMIAFQFDCGWMANPIFSEDGDYPKIMKERIYENSMLAGFSRSELPSFSLEEIATIRYEFPHYYNIVYIQIIQLIHLFVIFIEGHLIILG